MLADFASEKGNLQRMTTKADVVIVGAGLAGLCCARALAEAGMDFQVVEASDGVGGRVRTDHIDGYSLDRAVFRHYSKTIPKRAACSIIARSICSPSSPAR